MWILQRKSDGKSICLLSNKEYTVGRKNCTIDLADDLSVSRRHLKLIVEYSSNLDSGQPVLKVMDLGSTYGIYIISNPSDATNPHKADPNTWTTLSVNMSFHFGVKNEWIVKWKNINVICSALGSVERRKLNQQLVMLGAKLILNWQNDITHLVTDKISLTQKVLDSLLAGKPIVEARFFENWVQKLEQDPWSSMPDFSEFIPIIGQETLGQFDRNVFLPKEERQSLFLGKTFVFATTKESSSSMAEAVEKAGGKVTTNVEDFNAENSVLVENKSLSLPENYVQLSKSLLSRGERSIPEKEIGLAILACSVERFCNPCVMSVDKKNVDSQGLHGRASVAFTNSCLLDRETLPENLTEFTSQSRRNEEPPLKRTKVETAASSKFEHITFAPVLLKEKRKRTENTTNNQLELPQLPAQNINTADVDSVSGKNEPFQPPQKRMHLDQLHHPNIETSPTTQQIGDVTKTKKQLSNLSEKRCEMTKPTTAVPSRTEVLNSSTSRSEGLNDTVKSDSSRQWHGRDSPRKLNTSKCILKSNLVRFELPDKGTLSQKAGSHFKESHIVSRVRSMKIACLKEGKWTTKY